MAKHKRAPWVMGTECYRLINKRECLLQIQFSFWWLHGTLPCSLLGNNLELNCRSLLFNFANYLQSEITEQLREVMEWCNLVDLEIRSYFILSYSYSWFNTRDFCKNIATIYTATFMSFSSCIFKINSRTVWKPK